MVEITGTTTLLIPSLFNLLWELQAVWYVASVFRIQNFLKSLEKTIKFRFRRRKNNETLEIISDH